MEVLFALDVSVIEGKHAQRNCLISKHQAFDGSAIWADVKFDVNVGATGVKTIALPTQKWDDYDFMPTQFGMVSEDGIRPNNIAGFRSALLRTLAELIERGSLKLG
ncbi:hypothetical protein [Paraburkholderia sp. 32]|uniref:hypothetical protein n=1 Tax=Paraburkholderia sp. 32 TaxID=2991057 RepID=UPI003D25BCFB